MAAEEHPGSPDLYDNRQYIVRIVKLLNEDYMRFFKLGTAMAHGNEQDGKDIVQRVLINILQMRDKPPDFLDDALSYLCGAILKESCKFFREHVRRRIDENIRAEDLDRPILEPMADDPMIERLRKAMEYLDPYWAQALTMRHCVGFTEREIALKLGTTEGVVRGRLARAREKLALLMEDPESKRGRGRPSKVLQTLRKAGEKIADIMTDPGR